MPSRTTAAATSAGSCASRAEPEDVDQDLDGRGHRRPDVRGHSPRPSTWPAVRRRAFALPD
ncbi:MULTISPECIES: hypothetical protein [Streptomyces]|uniref:Uncharacterized protein n=1 Tax=Streptomyces fimbriatus TaxID=68197 RepID=A0ABW0D7C9_STRFI